MEKVSGSDAHPGRILQDRSHGGPEYVGREVEWRLGRLSASDTHLVLLCLLTLGFSRAPLLETG